MFGLNIKITALLFNILTVQGNVFREEKYLQDANHIEHYQSTYSDFPRSDYFDNAFKTDFHVGQEFKPRYYPSRFDYGNFGKMMLPDWFPKLLNPDYIGPIDPVKPTRPDGSDQGRIDPSRNGRNKMCQNIKGLPKPESGCCGMQVTRDPFHRQHPGYPNNPWWSELQSNRYRRSTDKHEPPNKMISGGRATDLHHLPWTARLVIYRLPGVQPKFCGATVISSRYVITAAHCLYDTYKDLADVQVFLAEYDTDTYPKDCIKRDGKIVCVHNKVMEVDHVILHDDYDDTYLLNDIALVRLSTDIPYTPFIRPVCLPPADIADLKEEDIVIAGWGLNGKEESHLKQAAFVNYVSNDTCKEQYPYKDDSMFCSIGAHGEDICRGDSGGPLMVVKNKQFFLSGIINGKRNDTRCGSSVPSLFNNVFHHTKWIIKHVS